MTFLRHGQSISAWRHAAFVTLPENTGNRASRGATGKSSDTKPLPATHLRKGETGVLNSAVSACFRVRIPAGRAFSPPESAGGVPEECRQTESLPHARGRRDVFDARDAMVDRGSVCFRVEKQVQRQMKCAEDDWDWCLNREWTRIHTNSGSDSVWVHFE